MMFSGLFGFEGMPLPRKAYGSNRYTQTIGRSRERCYWNWKKRISRRKIAKASRRKNYQVLGKRG